MFIVFIVMVVVTLIAGGIMTFPVWRHMWTKIFFCCGSRKRSSDEEDGEDIAPLRNVPATEFELPPSRAPSPPHPEDPVKVPLPDDSAAEGLLKMKNASQESFATDDSEETAKPQWSPDSTGPDPSENRHPERFREWKRKILGQRASS